MQTCHDYEDGPEISRSNTYIDGDSDLKNILSCCLFCRKFYNDKVTDFNHNRTKTTSRKFYRKLFGDVSLHSWGVLNKRVTMDDLGPPVKIVH